MSEKVFLATFLLCLCLKSNDQMPLQVLYFVSIGIINICHLLLVPGAHASTMSQFELLRNKTIT